MQITTKKTLNDSMVSIPNTLYASKISGKDIEIDNCYRVNNSYARLLPKMWNQPHPLIHTWLVLSSISICFLSALFFIVR